MDILDLLSHALNGIFCILILVIFIGIVIRLFKEKRAKTVKASAVVVNKQQYEKEVYRKEAVPYIKRECIVTFLCGGKRLNFEVSEYSYDGFVLNQSGILTYKGSRFLDFQPQSIK